MQYKRLASSAFVWPLLKRETPVFNPDQEPIMDTPGATLPLHLLGKGPEYFRARLLHRSPGVVRRERRSATQLLEESKALYVKCQRVRDQPQPPCQRVRDQPQPPCQRVQDQPQPPCQRVRDQPQPPCQRVREQPQPPCQRVRDQPPYIHTTLHSEPGDEVAGLKQVLQTPPSTSSDNSASPHKNKRPTSRGLLEDATASSREGRSCECQQAPADPSARSNLSLVVSHPHQFTDDQLQSDNTTRDDYSQFHLEQSLASDSGSDKDQCVGVIMSGQDKTQSPIPHDKPHHDNTSTPQTSSVGLGSPLANGRSPLSRHSATSKRDIPTISTEQWSELAGVPHHGSTSSLVKSDDITVRKRHKKAISRSRSDLTKRCSNSSDLSDISSRFSRNSADLEKFFNQMGLDRTVLDPMLSAVHAQSTSSLNVQESGSSVGSPWDARSWGSDESQRVTAEGSNSGGRPSARGPSAPTAPGMRILSSELEAIRSPPGHPSVVERNARVIKWLCGMRKSSSVPGPQTDSEG